MKLKKYKKDLKWHSMKRWNRLFKFPQNKSTFCRKTGTAEVFQDGESRVNSTYIGYAPINNPKLSFSIVYTNQPVPPPWLNGGDLGRDVINYYFDDKSNQFTFN